MRNLLFMAIAMLFAACDNNNNPFVYQNDAHGRGKTHLFIEESFKPLFTTCIETFLSQYPKARIKGYFDAENKIIEAFYNNKTKTIVITRDFNDQEKAYLKSKNVSYHSDKIATDAIALIMHPGITDTVM
ncbi:MAG: hypothetical protein ACKOGD_08760, partial [Sphingomonadales bacterium]